MLRGDERAIEAGRDAALQRDDPQSVNRPLIIALAILLEQPDRPARVRAKLEQSVGSREWNLEFTRFWTATRHEHQAGVRLGVDCMAEEGVVCHCQLP